MATTTTSSAARILALEMATRDGRLTFAPLEHALGHLFSEPSLLVEALTHRSWVHEHPGETATRDQQRLEFLGDAFLGYSVASTLYKRLSALHADEGELTVARSGIVGGANCAAIGERLELERYLFLGKGETKALALNHKVFEDTVEALVGAVLVDGGEAAAHAVVERLFIDGVDIAALSHSSSRDPVTQFKQLWEGRFRGALPVPEATFSRSGSAHAPCFVAKLELPAEYKGASRDDAFRGAGASKAIARRNACEEAVQVLLRDPSFGAGTR